MAAIDPKRTSALVLPVEGIAVCFGASPVRLMGAQKQTATSRLQSNRILTKVALTDTLRSAHLSAGTEPPWPCTGEHVHCGPDMSNKYFVGAWAAVAVLSLIEAVNGISKTLGWGLVIDSPIEFDLSSRTTTGWAPIYFIEWFLLQLPLIALTHEVLSRNQQRAPWARLPSLVGMPDLSETRFTRTTHKITLTLLLSILVYAGCHFFNQTLDADVYCGSQRVISDRLDHFALKSHEERCYLDRQGAGPQYYPQWETWAFLISLIVILSSWVWFSVRLVRENAATADQDPSG